MPAEESGSVFHLDLASSVALGPWAPAMADLMVELHASFPDPDAVASVIAAWAVKILPDVTAAGVVRIGKDGVVTCQVATNPHVSQLVQAEHRTGLGPCRDVLVLAGRAKVVVGDLLGDRRWPQYAAEALSVGIAGVMAVRLDAGVGVTDQVLLLVTDSVFHRPVVDVVDAFAAHAAVAAAQARMHTDLVGAVHSRDVIGQAKGILMERYEVSSGEAFALLVKTSQNSNVPLRQLAGQVADTGRFTYPRLVPDFQRYTLGAGPRR